jgi:hypothetical protein
MRRAAKIDDNQTLIVTQLRRIPNLTVAITSMIGKGFVDIIVGYKGKNYLIELKDENKPPSKRKLTPGEEEFFAEWKGQVSVCKNFDEVWDVINN